MGTKPNSRRSHTAAYTTAVPSPGAAHATALALNNRWFLDGRDANSPWVIGLHDRTWAERPVFGKVRSVNAAGLERECNVAAYARKVERLAAGTGQSGACGSG